jgi:hypothetical protein
LYHAPPQRRFREDTSKALLQSLLHCNESAADPVAREFHVMSVAGTHICHGEATEHS